MLGDHIFNITRQARKALHQSRGRQDHHCLGLGVIRHTLDGMLGDHPKSESIPLRIRVPNPGAVKIIAEHPKPQTGRGVLGDHLPDIARQARKALHQSRGCQDHRRGLQSPF